MSNSNPIAIVGLAAILPDAANPQQFWQNILGGRVSISEVSPDRWDPALYYHPDPTVPDKTYSKLGGWVRHFYFEPKALGLAIPPRVLSVMDEAQQWALTATLQVLEDYGYPRRTLDADQTAVIIGNSIGAEQQIWNALRVYAPEFLQGLRDTSAFQQLAPETQEALLAGVQSRVNQRVQPITEDSMPGDLANIIAGRVSNLFNFSGANFVIDAACASSLAAIQAAIDGLNHQRYDAVISGGIDRSMGVESYVKFCKIGALSPDGSRPYDAGANGFIMGEGASLFLLKRLEDAESSGDRIYAVIRGIGSSSDGKGKGITAPNVSGQQRAIERAWQDAGLLPQTAGLIEGHGSATRVGDVVEVQALCSVFEDESLPPGAILLGSVKSNIGHIKSAAGAAGLLKATLALHHKVLPPTASFKIPNPEIDFPHTPFFVNSRTQPWETPKSGVRHAGVSSFGFGGANFHLVLEEYLPGYALSDRRIFSAVTPDKTQSSLKEHKPQTPAAVDRDEAVTRQVLECVSQVTGYPIAEIELDMDMEADLGIDSIKSAEILDQIYCRFSLTETREEATGQNKTIADVIGELRSNLGKENRPSPPAPTVTGIVETVGTPVKHKNLPDLAQHIFLLAADSFEALQVDLNNATLALQSAVSTLPSCPAHVFSQRTVRLAIHHANPQELRERLSLAQSFHDPAYIKTLKNQGIYFGKGKPGKLAFLFPGQGSQYIGMGKDLAVNFPTAGGTIREADATLAGELEKTLSSYFIPPDDQVNDRAEMLLRDTGIAQPALIAVEIACLRVLAQFGVVPDMASGHSLGEIAALAAAGVFSFAEALMISRMRGMAINAVCPPGEGAMLAVAGSLDQVEGVLSETRDAISIANYNSPRQCVLSGKYAAISAAQRIFQARGIPATLLPVSHAFHSRQVAPAAKTLRTMLAQTTMRPAEFPVIANLNGDFYPGTPEEIREMLARQLAEPVQFLQGICTLHEAGCRTFVEVGPKRVLSGLVAEIFAGEEDTLTLAVDHPRQDSLTSFSEVLCGLLAAGYAVPGICTPDTNPSAGMVPQLTREEPVQGDLRPAGGRSFDPPAITPGTIISSDNPKTIIRRRIPQSILRPLPERYPSSGIALDATHRVLIIGGTNAATKSLVHRLEDRSVQTWTLPATSTEEFNIELLKLTTGVPFDGIYHLAALEPEEPLLQCSVDSWNVMLEQRILNLVEALRRLRKVKFLVCATRMGGHFGFENGEQNLMGGALCGLAKAYQKEAPDTLVKTVDFSSQATEDAIAGCLIAETLNDKGPLEIGYQGTLRWGITNSETPFQMQYPMDLNQETVFLVSGGSGGIVLPVILDLARRTHGRFYLIGSTPVLAEGHPLRGIMQEMQALGSKVDYLPCDITNPVAVQSLINHLLTADGKIDVFLHAAGMEHSSRLENKTREEFCRTLAVKASGFFYLIRAMIDQGKSPRAVIAFSSLAARYGNLGQMDYAAANELLGKMAGVLQKVTPQVKTLVIDWGPWAEVGMASHGRLPEVFRRMGIDLLPPLKAAPLVFQELQATSDQREVILAGALGPFEKIDTSARESANEYSWQTVNQRVEGTALLYQATGLGFDGQYHFNTRLDADTQPFLHDHALRGIPTFPAAMGIHGFSDAAVLIAGTYANPARPFHLERLEDIQFRAALRVQKSKPKDISWNIRITPQGEYLHAAATLTSTYTLIRQETITHFSAKLILSANESSMARTSPTPAAEAKESLKAEEIYRLFFHGPYFQVLDQVFRESTGAFCARICPIEALLGTPPNRLAFSPHVIEACLQVAGVWEVAEKAMMTIPQRVASIDIYPLNKTPGTLFIRAWQRHSALDQVSYTIQVMNGAGDLLLVMDGLKMIALPSTVEQALIEPFRKIL